ncbi:hypothetical protein BDR06DRAFT_972099 [Suillus hirtellus]|nr:hypothetical protein BDR06DRAFT_972099 [Suillus hirtellus]
MFAHLPYFLALCRMIIFDTQLVPTPDSLRKQAKIRRSDIIRILQPLAVKGSMFTSAANRIVQTGIATVIVLEYSAFLADDLDDLKCVESAVEYYLKSPTAIAVEKGAEEISRQSYEAEELEKKILEFILENRLYTALQSQLLNAADCIDFQRSFFGSNVSYRIRLCFVVAPVK